VNPSNPQNPANPAKPEKPSHPANPPADDGLKRLLTWTFIALGVTLVLAAIGVSLVIYFFDPGANW
jgi:hypothetical protein